MSAKQVLLLSRQPDSKQVMNLMRAVHFNFVYFSNINYMIQGDPFEQLFADLALHVAKCSTQMSQVLLDPK